MGTIDPLIQQIPRIGIVGTGLLGASLGLSLKAAGYTGRIVGYGRTITSPEQARVRGAIDQSITGFSELARTCGLVILCTPVGTFASFFEKLAAHAGPNVIITDVGSTKRLVCEQAEKLLNHPANFIGSHPMAGGELRGPQHAQADLFHGKPCILTPTDQTGEHAEKVAAALWRSLGMNLLTLSPHEHDQRAARISHLPRAVASLLIELAAEHDDFDIASTGLCDTTRLASGDERMWLDIFLSNREPLIQAVDAMAAKLQILRQRLVDQDQAGLEQQLRLTKTARDHWLDASST